jgi:SAM-dependent methyltransferase/pimeloyl-ACP methyl ester carboxylesterase
MSTEPNTPVLETVERITSDRICYPSRNGYSIAAFLDRPAALEDPVGYIVMAPKYGETKKNNLQLAYYLAANGFCVLRFDQTCHLGESEGDMSDFTLVTATDDILGSIDLLEQTFGIDQAIVLASSLSVRSALRAAAMDKRISHCVCLVGVVSLQTTLRRIYGEDLVTNHLAGKPLEMLDMFGFEIDGERFLRTAVESGLHDLEATRDDLERIDASLVYYHAEQDAWVDFEEVRALFENRSNVRLHRIAGAMHEIKENATAAEETFSRIVRDCLDMAGKPAWSEIARPDRKGMFVQNRIEREALRKLRKQDEDEKQFWSDYLTEYEWMGRSIDYWAYLRRLGTLLGGIRSGEILLDAGCGNGFFGLQYLRDVASRKAHRPLDHCIYLGLDLTESGLASAVGRHCQAAAPMRSDSSAGFPPTFIYGRADFEQVHGKGSKEARTMPKFAPGTFDKICCSLLLSYLKTPERLVQEFYHLLKPNGRLVISSMKPHCDLGALFAEFTRCEEDLENVKHARSLLRAAGQIKVKAEIGVYAFFSEDDLTGLVRKAGFRTWEVHRSFGDQVNILMAQR